MWKVGNGIFLKNAFWGKDLLQDEISTDKALYNEVKTWSLQKRVLQNFLLGIGIFWSDIQHDLIKKVL